MHVPIARPSLGAEEREAVLEVLSGSQFTKGTRVEAFEGAFADYHGAVHAIATNTGSSALVTALRAHGLGPGDEVIVPSFSFFATAACVVAAGATPVFADIEPDTYCLSPAAALAAVGERTRAILLVHLYGMPADLPGFRALCAQRGLLLLEDAAQAHGASLDGRRIGSSGTAAFSFFPTKNMTTIEGGMLLTDDPEVARRARMIRNHGRGADGTHETWGTNFRMTEIQAAIGLVQLHRLPEFTESRVRNAGFLSERLRNVSAPALVAGRTHVFHQYTVRARNAGARDQLRTHLADNGVESRVYYARPIHREPAFADSADTRSADLPETERACREVLSLPVHPGLTRAQLAHVVDVVNAFG